MDRPEVTLANADAVYDFYRDHRQPRLLALAAYAMLAARYRPRVNYRGGARDALRAVIAAGLLESAHDVSDGGLAIALAEAGFGADGLGCDVDLPGGHRLDSVLFAEDPGVVVVSAPGERLAGAAAMLAKHGVLVREIGVVTRGKLRIRVAGALVVDENLADLEAAWEAALPALLAREHDLVPA